MVAGCHLVQRADPIWVQTKLHHDCGLFPYFSWPASDPAACSQKLKGVALFGFGRIGF